MNEDTLKQSLYTASSSQNVNGMRELSILLSAEEKVDGSSQALCFTATSRDARIRARILTHILARCMDLSPSEMQAYVLVK